MNHEEENVILRDENVRLREELEIAKRHKESIETEFNSFKRFADCVFVKYDNLLSSTSKSQEVCAVIHDF